MRKSLIIVSLVLLVAIILSSVLRALALNEEIWGAMISTLLSDPKALMIFVAQFGLGFGLGYFSIKALKYILAMAAILAIGVLLNVWYLGGIKEFFDKLGIEWAQLLPMIHSIVSALGFLTVLPIAMGFFLGIIVAAIKR